MARVSNIVALKVSDIMFHHTIIGNSPCEYMVLRGRSFSGTPLSGSTRGHPQARCSLPPLSTRVVPTRDPSKLQPSLVWLRAFGFCKVPD
eukprot:g37689.t1